MAKHPPYPDSRAEPELDDVRGKDLTFDFEPLAMDHDPQRWRDEPVRPRRQTSSTLPVLGVLAGLLAMAGLVWGGMMAMELGRQWIQTQVENQVAAERALLGEEKKHLEEERQRLETAKNQMQDTLARAEQKHRTLTEEHKKLHEEKNRLEEDLKKQTEARQKAEEIQHQLEEREHQTRDKQQAEEERRQQEEHKRAEEAKALILERTRLADDKKQLEQERKQWEELRKAREEKARSSESPAVGTPTIEAVDRDLGTGHLIFPKGNNAMEKLEWLAKLDPQNKVLLPRWARLAELLVHQADEAMAVKDFKSAEESLAAADKISFAREAVGRARQRLTQAREAAKRLDADLLRQAEEEELQNRLERQPLSPGKATPQPVQPGRR